MAADTDKQSFWEHLDVLRAAIVKSLLVAVVFGVAAFCFKEELFAVILAPKDADFITYRLLYSLGGLVTESGVERRRTTGPEPTARVSYIRGPDCC